MVVRALARTQTQTRPGSHRRWFVGAAIVGLAAIIVIPVAGVDAQTDSNDKAAESKAKVAKMTTAPSAPAKKIKIRENNYYYSAFNRRDPFRSLVVGEFVSEKRMKPVELGRVELVGVVRGDLDRFALLEDDKGFSYILRIGDRVRNGSVVAIGDDSMVARITNFGQTSKVTLHLAKRGEDK